MTTAQLQRQRDIAQRQYLAVKRAGGASKRKLKRLQAVTVKWYQAVKEQS
jgi:hypothetical protein